MIDRPSQRKRLHNFPDFSKSRVKDFVTSTSWEQRGRFIYVKNSNIMVDYASKENLETMEQHNINILVGLPYGTI